MALDNNKYNIKIFQGSTFGLTITLKDSSGTVQDLTGYSARMQIRSSYDSGTTAEELTTSNGEITITAAEGNVALQLSASRTAGLYVDLSSTSRPPKTTYVYDLELVDSANPPVVSKILYGDFNVYAEVTK